MENKGFKEGLLKDKIKKFKFAVIEAAEKLGVKQPPVKIWNCPTLRDNAIAHCHLDSGMICITEKKLVRLSDEEIFETATHEVTHLVHGNHEYRFQNTHNDLKTATWRAPTGVGIQSYSEADLARPVKKSKPSKPDNKKCNYYQGSEHKKGKLLQCSYCKGYFCELHSNPRPAGTRSLDDYNSLSREMQEEVNNPNSHPCISYLAYFEKKAKEQERRYGDALNRVLSKSINHKPKKSNWRTPIFSASDYKEEVETDNLEGSKDERYNPDYDEIEQYEPGKNNRGKTWHWPKIRFGRESFRIGEDITSHFVQLLLIAIVGLVLEYVYYNNFSLHYLFMGGIREWFNILQATFSFGLVETYNLFYLIINGIYYFFLYSYSVSLLWAVLTNLHKKGTWVFMMLIALAGWVIVNFLPEVIY